MSDFINVVLLPVLGTVLTAVIAYIGVKLKGILEEGEKETREEVKGLREDIQSLMQKPAKRWEALVAAAIGAVVTGLIAFIFFKFGLKP